MEVFLQVALQVALLLLTQTLTATVGGLETFFAQDKMFNVSMDPTTIITLSVILSLKTAILLHVKILGMEKGGYFGFLVADRYTFDNHIQNNYCYYHF